MGIVGSENNVPDKSGMFSKLKALTNLTSQDLEVLKNIASGNLSTVQNDDKQMSDYLNMVERAFNRSGYNYGDNSPQTRRQLYEIYDEMDNEVSYVSAALDIISDDAAQPDEEGNIITVIAESEKVQALAEDFLDDFNIDGRISKWARAVAKYGDFFVRVVSEDGKGITKIHDNIYPSNIERLDLDGELVAFTDTSDLTTEKVCPPWEYVHFKHKGDIIVKDDRANNILSSGADNYDLSSTYGMSMLRPAVKVYAQLRFVENMILLSRLTNSIRRNIFMVNVGDVAPDKSFETIKNYADLLKKNIDLDLENGVYSSQKKTIPYDEDIFIPVSDPKNDVRIEQVGGDANIAEQYDLEYLLNKLFSALKIPKAYLNYEQDLNARSTLIQLDIRYARSVANLQQTLRGGILRLLYINLAFHGLDPNTVMLDVKLPPVSTIDAESKRQETLARVEVANSIWRTVTEINDKLSGGDPMAALMGGAPPQQDESNDKDKVSVNLDYAAELIFSEYLGFSQEEVSKILNKPNNEGSEDSKSSKYTNKVSTKTIVFRKVKSSDPDVYAPYPTNEGRKLYESLRESINMSRNTNS